MMSKFLDSIRAYQQQMKIASDIEMLKDHGLYAEPIGAPMTEEEVDKYMFSTGDVRYNTPKEDPKASEELVEETILSTEIYRRARLAVIQTSSLSPDTRNVILDAQRKQVAYGIDKYPEPLNPNTWTISETVDHIMDESIDRLHYLVMLTIKLEQELISGAYNDIIEVRNVKSRIVMISGMVDNAIKELDYLIKANDLMDKDREVEPNDSMDAISYTMTMSGADYDGDKLMYTSSDQDKLNKLGTV